MKMNQKTRDNLIYLSVALSIVAVVVVDFFYADARGQQMWLPSRFASRAVYTTALLAYFVGREARKARATLASISGCILFGSIVNLAILFIFRRTVEELPGIPFSIVAVFGIFIVYELTMTVARYLQQTG